MSLSNAAESAMMLLYFNATAWANVADNAASSPITNWQVSLHTADPGEAGNQATSEAGYTSYARVAVARTSGGWTHSSGTVNPVANITFPQATGGTATVTHFGLGTAASSTGVLHWSGTVSPNISVATGVTPILTTSTAISID